jgi:hypothetical protein
MRPEDRYDLPYWLAWIIMGSGLGFVALLLSMLITH